MQNLRNLNSTLMSHALWETLLVIESESERSFLKVLKFLCQIGLKVNQKLSLRMEGKIGPNVWKYV